MTIMVHEAFLSGIWSAIGSVLGKLSGMTYVVGEGYILWAMFLILMVMANTCGCRHYLHALSDASNSVVPTVISAATSYILSGIFGVIIFDETASINWWIGAIIITFGLALVAQPRSLFTKTK